VTARANLREAWLRFNAWTLPIRALFVVVATANFVLLAITIRGFFVGGAGYDWLIYLEAGRRVLSGELFEWSGAYAWSYSPLLAYGFAFLAPIGIAGWSLLHFGALAFLPARRLAVLGLISWPFWVDLYNGNTMTFVFVAAAAALGGSSVGTFAYLGLCALMPRPLMLPLLVWILWRRPAWRLRFVLVAIVSLAGAFATGFLPSWVGALLGVGDAVAVSSRDIGPSAVIGPAWVAVGALLAAILTVRGRLGWASLAASPYWLPQYLLMLLLEMVPLDRVQMRSERRPLEAGTAPTPSTEHPRAIPARRDERDQH
jgi:hypothetical protein